MEKVEAKETKEKKPKGTFNGSISIPMDLIPVWENLKKSNRSGIVQLVLKTAALCKEPNDVEMLIRELYYSKLKESKEVAAVG